MPADDRFDPLAILAALERHRVAYVLIGASFGLTPEMALAVSLLKRARDLVIGLPALGVWQAVEGGYLWRRVNSLPDAAGGPDRR